MNVYTVDVEDVLVVIKQLNMVSKRIRGKR